MLTYGKCHVGKLHRQLAMGGKQTNNVPLFCLDGMLTPFYVALLALLAPKWPWGMVKKRHFSGKFSREFDNKAALYGIISMPGCNKAALYGIISMPGWNKSTPHEKKTLTFSHGEPIQRCGATRMNSGATRMNSGAAKMNTLKGYLVQVVQVVQLKKSLLFVNRPVSQTLRGLAR